jgi:hypothetical protein
MSRLSLSVISKTESWKQDKRIVSAVYDLAVKAFDALIINHGYTFEELDNLRKDKDIYSVWIEIIKLVKYVRRKKIKKKNDVKFELAKYYTTEQIFDSLKLVHWKGF